MGGIFRMWCLALLVLLFCTHSWGALNLSRAYDVWGNWVSGYDCVGSAIPSCQQGASSVVPSGYYYTGYCFCNNGPSCSYTSGTTDCRSHGVSASSCSGYHSYNCYAQYSNNKAEADSIYCINNPTAERCGNCKAADTTWYNNAVDSCNAVYGENNYSIVDTNDVCEHRGHCCSADSTIDGNVCTWKCESVASQCQPPLNFYSGILLDTTASDTGDVVQGRCYYNCINYVPSDTTKAMVSGNILLTGPVSAMSQGTKVPNAFNSVRTTDNDTYIYDYLFPQAEHYLDSIAFTPCVQALYRGVLNGKYVYWYDNQPVPAGVTNIVKIK